MAIVTHKTSKNARYSDVLEYYSYRHKESAKTGYYEPILDEYGFMQERTSYAVICMDARGRECEPERWAMLCRRTNEMFGKNRRPEERKSHEYILSHPAEDREKMTMEDLLDEGRAFVRDNLYGYDALIAVHRDTDNDHIHISINSVRTLARPRPESWMMRDEKGEVLACELNAGAKHQDSPGLRMHMNEWLLEYTRQHDLMVKDNNAITAARKQESHGGKNEQMRKALLEAAARSTSREELCRILRDDYGMELKISGTGRTISVLYPGNQKYVRLRTLGLEPKDLLPYEFDEAHLRREREEEERKRYIDWICERRRRNNERAQEATERAEWLLAQKLRGKGERYDRSEFRTLNDAIRQMSYLDAALQTEKEKLDRLLSRWELYADGKLPFEERRRHKEYVEWCGCAPDDPLELGQLKEERAAIERQQQQAVAFREVLAEEAELWRGVNEQTRAINDLEWLKRRETQLKRQLKYTKARRKKLYKIFGNCVCAMLDYAEKNGGTPGFVNPKWDNVWKFRDMVHEKDAQIKRMQGQLEEVKVRKKAAKKRVREGRGR